MAKVIMNELMKAFRGSIGGLVFRLMPDGSVVVSSGPDFSRRKFSQGQKDHQHRFRDASAYASCAAKTQPIYAELAKGTMKTAYNIALSDWFNPPVIHEVSQQSGYIRVNANDNVQVAKVRIMILDPQGQTLEQGEAAQVNEIWWELETNASTEGKVIVEAFDLAGNCTKHKT